MSFLLRFIGTNLVLVATLLSACSTISSRQTLNYPFPPAKAEDIWGRDPVATDHALEQKYKADPSNEPMRLLVRYQQAKLWAETQPEKSCTLWLEVAKQPRFPLVQIARIHAMEVCSAERSKDLPTLTDIISKTQEPWLREMLVRSALIKSQRVKDKVWEMKLSAQAADFETLQSEKVKLLDRARKLALETKADSAFEMTIRNRLESSAPRFIEKPSTGQYLAVAADFRQARDFASAREWYAKVVDAEEFTDLERLKALDGIRMTYKLEKKTEKYLEETRAYSDFARKNLLRKGVQISKKDPSSVLGRALISKYLDTRLTLARAVWTEDSARSAEQILRDTEQELGRRTNISESILIRARIEEEAGRFANAVQLLWKIDVNKLSTRDMKSKVLWYRAWNLRKTNKLKEAAASFESLLKEEDNPTLAARDRFWLARTLRDLGREDDAKAQFTQLTETDSIGWYGLLAFREMKQLIPALGRGDSSLRAPAAVSSTDHEPLSEATAAAESALLPDEKLTLEWLISTGENELARRFLDFTTADRRAAYTDGQTLDLLRCYARAGNYQSLFARLYELPQNTRKRLLDANPELLFPQPWAHIVTTASSRFDIQRELIYSIMRQESSFNPDARSGADAFGLMQLIPESAKRAENMSGIKIAHHDELYHPETNIPLGTAFLRELMNHWQGSFIPTVASYNASEKAIAGWIKTRYRKDPLEFVEDVPYEETRNYIKLVMRNFIFYKRLNSGGAPIEFPEWCLANLQDIKL